MGPQLLIDITLMLNCTHEPTARGNAPAQKMCVLPEERDDKGSDQVKALVAGTLLFLPLLAGYVVLCANQ